MIEIKVSFATIRLSTYSIKTEREIEKKIFVALGSILRLVVNLYIVIRQNLELCKNTLRFYSVYYFCYFNIT